MKRFLERFKTPLSYFKPDNMDVVVGSAKRCLDGPDGDILLKHLINVYGLDDPVGNISESDMTYKIAQQDVIKHIIALTNDK